MSPARIAGLGGGALVLGLALTVLLADEAGVTGHLVPLFLVAALAGGPLAWVNELVEDGKVPRPVGLVLVAGSGVFVLSSLSEGRQFRLGLALFAVGVAGLVIAARRDELLEKAKQKVRRNGPLA
ncbi:hypothetical protein ABFU82_19505 [Nocardioides sp. WV_118_6]